MLNFSEELVKKKQENVEGRGNYMSKRKLIETRVVVMLLRKPVIWVVE